jgi:hypothetical protein
MFIVRTIRNTQIHCAGRMLSFGVLQLVVHILTTSLERVKWRGIVCDCCLLSQDREVALCYKNFMSPWRQNYHSNNRILVTIERTIPPLLHTCSWRGAYLITHRNNFTFTKSFFLLASICGSNPLLSIINSNLMKRILLYSYWGLHSSWVCLHLLGTNCKKLIQHLMSTPSVFMISVLYFFTKFIVSRSLSRKRCCRKTILLLPQMNTDPLELSAHLKALVFKMWHLIQFWNPYN